MKHKTLEHLFVKHFPEKLVEDVLYVSVEYGSVAHLCCCGCKEEVVTPLTPTDWRMIFDGKTVSLRPSVGSWTLACRSHYIIERNNVLVAQPWSESQVQAERQRDRTAKSKHYSQSLAVDPVEKPSQESAEPRVGFVNRLLNILFRRTL